MTAESAGTATRYPRPILRCRVGLLASISSNKHNIDMRTTVTLNDDVAVIATQYAESRDLSLSKAIAELIVRGTRRSARIKYVDGLPVFDLPKSKHPIAPLTPSRPSRAPNRRIRRSGITLLLPNLFAPPSACRCWYPAASDGS